MRRGEDRTAAVALLSELASSALAQYEAVPLGSLGGTHGASVSCVNNVGEAVGVSDTASGLQRGFYWHGGPLTELPPLAGGDTSRALWINNNGVAVGSSHNPSGQDRAVRWERDGQGVWHVTDLGTLGGATALANKISDSNII